MHLVRNGECMKWPFAANLDDKQVRYVYNLITRMLKSHRLNFKFNEDWNNFEIIFDDSSMKIYLVREFVEWKVWDSHGVVLTFKGKRSTNFPYSDAYRGIQELNKVISILNEGPRFFKR